MRADRRPSEESAYWVEHKKAIEWHKEDWCRLRQECPSYELITTGDYNQVHDGSAGYGTKEVRSLLSDALRAARLTCVTEMDFITEFGMSRRNIDHVCLTEEFSERVESVSAWESTLNGVQLSDHNLVVVDFMF